jgi:acetyltransferase-like isoleucine patch superfamily enzyme
MTRWQILIRYDLPLHFVLLLTNWLPDNVLFLRLRGYLARPYFGKCGVDLRLGRNVSFYNPSKIEIGAHVYLAYGCVLLAGTQPILLRDEVVMGPYCVLASENHTRQDLSYRYGSPQSAEIIVGIGCWHGAHVVVTAGSKIGQGTLVAAGAVVTESIPDNVLAGGVPARAIKHLVE